MSRVLRPAPADPAPLRALADALAVAVRALDGPEAVVSLDELQAWGAPPPCEVGALLAAPGGESALREWTARPGSRVRWRYDRRRGLPARFVVRPWGAPQDIHRHPPACAPLDRAARRAQIAEAAARLPRKAAA